MSVALVVTKINGVETQSYIPVATQDFFEKFWLPICEKYQLDELAQSKTGYSYTEHDIPMLIKQVEVFSEMLNKETGIPDETIEFMRLRANLLLVKLRELKGSTTEFFLG